MHQEVLRLSSLQLGRMHNVSKKLNTRHEPRMPAIIHGRLFDGIR